MKEKEIEGVGLKFERGWYWIWGEEREKKKKKLVTGAKPMIRLEHALPHCIGGVEIF
jgi:hypothetical protein